MPQTPNCCVRAESAGVTFQQLNELLLVLNQDRLSRAFFDFFLNDGTPSLSMDGLKQGVVKFKGYAMVCFGNFRFAYRELSTIDDPTDLRDELGPCCHECADIEAAYSRRAEKVLDVTPIARDDTWFVGEVTGTKLRQELKKFEEYRAGHSNAADDPEVTSFAKRLAEMDERFKEVQQIALRNTDVYLTWDHVDVYVATSMRNQWEYEEVFEFTQTVFKNSILADLKLRYFDPTQSKCRTRLDKGLLEGLMLKRANCTIYMAQETDTFGKDSELASTLAQGKPVIVYVPAHDDAEYARVVQERPLNYAKLRLLDLQGSGIVRDVDGLPRLAERFQDDLAKHRERQPLELWLERDASAFKNVVSYWPELCSKIAQAEKKAFDRRASILQKYHPLAIQTNLETGVANGVLVVRSINDCVELLRAILTNKAQFDIKVDEDDTDAMGRILVERISGSVFRAVTGNEKLTNSFWNLWGRQDRGRTSTWQR